MNEIRRNLAGGTEALQSLEQNRPVACRAHGQNISARSEDGHARGVSQAAEEEGTSLSTSGP